METNQVVLIIEDEESIRTVLQASLELEGYTVYTANNGRHALELLSGDLKPRVILLDLMMPEMNGVEFLNQFNQNKVWNNIKVVIVSAFTEQAKNIKADGFIRKPIDFNRLIDTVGKFCNS